MRERFTTDVNRKLNHDTDIIGNRSEGVQQKSTFFEKIIGVLKFGIVTKLCDGSVFLLFFFLY